MNGENFPPQEEQPLDDQEAPQSNKDAGLMFIVSVVVLAIGIYFGIAQGLAVLLVFPGIPLVLLWFFYWVFLRRWIRMRRIRGARERRLMMEAARRSSTSNRPGL